MVFLKKLISQIYKPKVEFSTSSQYWEDRYAAGLNSGSGSYGRLAKFKAEVLNRFVAEQSIQSVLEFGCGDGSQLELAEYPGYLGIDVSKLIVDECRRRFAEDNSKAFLHVDEYSGQQAELSLSLDVIYHLVEDEVFDAYMRRLFEAGTRWVVIYSSNDPSLNELRSLRHVKHRCFTEWISINCPNWKLTNSIPNRYPRNERRPKETSFADFYFFTR
jgi:SAM-dependent methyltransferase